ncbi:MAG TPA: glycosyltransferase family 1 protein [Rhodothermales bacterium]|nr:glycosyltransferase family 1 protein [Rhodothermales bacterium]
MRVLYVSDALAKRRRFGLGRYAEELAESLKAEAPDVDLVPVATHAEGAPPDGLAVLPGGRKLLAGAWSTVGLPPAEWVSPRFDVLHNVEMAYPVATRKPEVVTIHDLGPLTHPEWFSQARPRLKRAAVDRARRHADAVVCVSQATADAFVGLAGESVRDRIHVIHEGVGSFWFEPSAPNALGGLADLPADGTPFFLWMGSKLNPRKNLDRIVSGFERAAADLPHHLVLAGAVGWDAEDVLEQIRQSPVADRIHRPGFVTDAQLRALYRRAAGFLYVSRLEGFGLPILESMAAGGPVVTSSVSSMPEVAGEAALLVDPLDVDAIADAITRLATDSALADDLRSRGRARARTFQWTDCAREVAAVYRSIL